MKVLQRITFVVMLCVIGCYVYMACRTGQMQDETTRIANQYRQWHAEDRAQLKAAWKESDGFELERDELRAQVAAMREKLYAYEAPPAPIVEKVPCKCCRCKDGCECEPKEKR